VICLTIAIINNYKVKHDMAWQKRARGIGNAIHGFNNEFKSRDVMLQGLNVWYKDLEIGEVKRSVNDVAGVILSGSPYNIGDLKKNKDGMVPFNPVVDIIRRLDRPILGICFGHQLIGHAFGLDVGKCEDARKNNVKEIHAGILHVDSSFELLSRFHETREKDLAICVDWKHEEEIRLAENFETIFRNYASTDICKIQAIKHRHRLVFGVQFHPETDSQEKLIENRSPNDDGQLLLRSFFDIVVNDQLKGH